MALRTLEALKSYFFEHAYPTWQQFHDVLDSFRHKDDKIPINDVDGLADQLNGKLSSAQIETEAQLRADADNALQTNIDKKANNTDLTTEVQARTDADSMLQTNIDDKASLEDLNTEKQARQDADSVVMGKVTDETNARIAADATLQAAIDDARAIAEGRSRARVFDTVDVMNAWLAVAGNTATLNVGDNLLIRAINVSDYWWDGDVAQKLETQKVDLSTYVQNTRKVNGKELSADVMLTADDIAETSSRIWFTGALKSAYDGVVSWISTNGANLVAHLTNANNPHSITATQVGLGSVNNTADMDKPISTAVQNALNNISGIGGASYIYVAGKGTATANATELQAAYDKAKTMTPYGLAISVTNRVTIVVGAGNYTFGTPFTVNTNYIDIVSLTGRPDVFLNGITVSDKNVLLRGINCGSSAFTVLGNTTAINIATFEYCVGGDNSFGYGVSAPYTYVNCTAGINSFGGGMAGGVANGKYTNCTAVSSSFGYTNASGVFNNCISGNGSFGYISASGTFTNCTAGDMSFGYGSVASGIFTNCTAGSGSFGYMGASGTFSYCTSIGNGYAFGGTTLISATARLFYCRLSGAATTFKTPASGGRLILCIDGNNNVVTI